MSITLLLILNLLLIGFIFLISHFRWGIKTLRGVCHNKNEGGYTKFIQIGLISLLVLTFIAIVIYYFIDKSQVNKIDVILTVVVGWLGAIIGKFFGESAMEELKKKQRGVVSESNEVLEELKKENLELRKNFYDATNYITSLEEEIQN